MTNEIIFGVQILSLLTYIGALFYLYRVLVSQKEATIDLLKEEINFLGKQLEIAKNPPPDILAKSLSDRVREYSEELERLCGDKEKYQDRINKLDSARRKAQEEISQLKAQMKRAQEWLSEFFCPYCQAPMDSRKLVPATGVQIDEWIKAQEEMEKYMADNRIQEKPHEPDQVGTVENSEMQFPDMNVYTIFECGLELNDGKEVVPCGRKGRVQAK